MDISRRKFLQLATTAGFLFSFGKVSAASNEKILVVYFSRTGEEYGTGNITKGNTAIVAEIIAQKLNADIFEIKPVTPYPNSYEDCKKVASREKATKARPSYVGDVENFSRYTTVFVGYPIWYGDAPHLIKLYNKINGEIFGKVGIKLHTGEPHGPNILPRDMIRAFQAQVPNSNIIETNTLYVAKRYTTEDHRAAIVTNGWNFCDVDIMDEDENYVNFPVNGGFHLNEVAMGGHLVNYDSVVVLTHFKGHAMGGFGGSLKNIAIGMASGHLGKAQVHGYDTAKGMPPVNVNWLDESVVPLKEEFMERMADSGKATCDHFGKRIVFLNVMRRMSVDCDCAGTRAAEPTCADVGILASTDILAIDQACCDFVYTATDTKDLRERIESRHGLRQLSAMAEHKMGNPQYELIQVD